MAPEVACAEYVVAICDLRTVPQLQLLYVFCDNKWEKQKQPRTRTNLLPEQWDGLTAILTTFVEHLEPEENKTKTTHHFFSPPTG